MGYDAGKGDKRVPYDQKKWDESWYHIICVVEDCKKMKCGGTDFCKGHKLKGGK